MGTFIPEKGMHLPVLYNRENTSDAVAAKADWLTGALIPLRDNGENWMFIGLLILAFMMMTAGVVVKKYGLKAFGLGWFILGIDGLISGIATDIPALFLLCPIGAVGMFIVFAVGKQKASEK